MDETEDDFDDECEQRVEEMTNEAKKLADEIRSVLNNSLIRDAKIWGNKAMGERIMQLGRLHQVADALDRFDPNHEWNNRYR